MNRLNYSGDVRDSFTIDEYAMNIYGETMTDTVGYPLMVRGIEFDGTTTTLEIEVVGRPARGAK